LQKKNSGNSEKKLTPDVVNCGEYFDIWFQRLEDNNEVRPRTLRYYKSYLDIYLHPFFGEESFSFINKTSLYDFYKWARERNYKPGKSTNQNKEMKPGRTIVLVHRKMEKSIRSVREFEFVFILSFCRHGGML
jgi:hypothetical protein